MGKSNSLSNTLDFRIAESFNDFKNQGVNPTQNQILEVLKSAGFNRIPLQLLQKQINMIGKLDQDKKDEEKLKEEKLKAEKIEKIQKKVKRQEEETILYDKVNTNIEYLIAKTPNLDRLGGLDKFLPQIKQMIMLPLQHQDIFKQINIEPPKGILITGISGSGKTVLGLSLCKFLYENNEIPFTYISATEITGGISGESENNLRNVFKKVQENQPSVLFIDELDAIAGKKDNAQKDMEKRVILQTLVIAASSKPENLDPGLRRAGRFDKEFPLQVPDESMRNDIITKILKDVKIDQNVDIKFLSQNTPGFVPADLNSLVKEAGLIAVKRITEMGLELNHHLITQNDFLNALKTIQPTAKREGFAVVPDVNWDDIGALQSLKQDLQNSIILPITQPQKFKKMGVDAPAGILLYGPPGCGKTLLAKAVANASQANFIAIKGPELLNKYVGESEKAVRSLFQRARFSQPCIIFFDELDALCPKRGQEGNNSSERVVNQLLTEMQGLEERQQVYVIAATNRPDMIDAAMMRPGRLDQLLYVPMPNNQDKIQILKAQAKKCPIDNQIWTFLEDQIKIDKLQGYSGADLGAIIKQAALQAILKSQDIITQENIEVALQIVKPSLSEKDQIQYEKLKENLRGNKTNLGNN